ncbi:hypothetical protein O9992_16650 [Vibrio lentus]|nr:hypothetical protein [Vibrio lentus]
MVNDDGAVFLCSDSNLAALPDYISDIEDSHQWMPPAFSIGALHNQWRASLYHR